MNSYYKLSPEERRKQSFITWRHNCIKTGLLHNIYVTSISTNFFSLHSYPTIQNMCTTTQEEFTETNQRCFGGWLYETNLNIMAQFHHAQVQWHELRTSLPPEAEVSRKACRQVCISMIKTSVEPLSSAAILGSFLHRLNDLSNIQCELYFGLSTPWP